MAATQPTRRSGAIRLRATGTDTKAKPGSGSTGPADKSVPQVASELWTLTVDYAKQEIKDPVKGLGSLPAVGLAFDAAARRGLRAPRHRRTPGAADRDRLTFTGSLSWAPYLIVLSGALIVLGLVGTFMTRGKKK